MFETVKKSTLVILGILLLFFAGSMLLLRYYEVDLIHTIVLNAVLQKAPEGYPQQEISQVFASARRRAQENDREEAYLEELFTLSRRLEKIQLLSREELEELLDQVRDIPERIRETGGRRQEPLLTLAGGVSSLSNPDFREELSPMWD